eukprot:CAMPEP_0175142892 /NCGR_PEP_ID=MMETSP0087-20121206/13089_1 /TAXON_ID=136419 /ORGANISM="Unknown Unknown, Strain D1" /LENGTH=477 /DNA_ID=CAMNT_0016426821 /DNA_START=45 /DNA_END=1478 /DNA_ORIENTATION=+
MTSSAPRQRWVWRPKAQGAPGAGSAVGAKITRRSGTPATSRKGGRQKKASKIPDEPPTIFKKHSLGGVGNLLLNRQISKTKTFDALVEDIEGAGDGWDELGRFLDCVRTISSEIRPEEAAEKIIDECCKIVQADRSTMFFVDTETNELVLIVAKGANNIRLPIGKGIAGTVAATGTTLNIPDAYQDDRFDQSFDKASGYKTTAVLATPVLDPSGSIVAVLQCINKVSGGAFNPADKLLLERVASHVGVVLHNAKLYEGERNAKAKVAAMLDIIKMLHSGHSSAHSLIFALSNRCHDLVDGDRCTLYLVDRNTSQLVVMQGDIDIRFPMHLGLAGAVATSGQHLIIEDAYNDERFNKSIDLKTGYRTKAMLVMPVFGANKEGKKEVVGVLQIINKIDDCEVFTHNDYDMLATILDIAGPILDNSNIFQSKSTKRDVDDTFESSQMSALPKKEFTPLSTPLGGFGEEEEEEEEEDDEFN